MMKQEPVKPKFPTMLRKMWSGSEVQQWLDEQDLFTTPQPTPTVQAAVAAALRKAAEVCRSYYSVEGIAQRCEAEVIALPHDDTALMEFGVKVAEEVHTEGDIGGVGVSKRLEAIVNRVMKGE